LSKHEILTHAGKISAKAAELKAKTEYKKYKELHLYDVSKAEKNQGLGRYGNEVIRLRR